MKLVKWVGIWIVAGGTLFAQPAIRSGGVANAANLAPAGLPNSGIAQGARFVIFGTGLGADNGAITDFLNGTTDPGDTTVQVTVGGSTVNAYIVAVSPTRAVAVLPSATPIGTGQVMLTTGGASSTTDINVVASRFGIFTRGLSSSGAAAAKNVNDDGSLADNLPTQPARPGKSVTIYGTGLGAAGDESAGPMVADVPGDVTVFVGGQQASVTSKSRTDCCGLGVDQVTFQVPAGIEGCGVPVVVRTGGVVSNFAGLSISSQGSCSDPNGFSASDFDAFQAGTTYNTGSISLIKSSTAIQMLTTMSESAGAAFTRIQVDDVLGARNFGTVTLGACMVTYFNDALPFNITLTLLDAGPALTVNGPNGSKQLLKQQGTYFADFGTSVGLPGLPSTTPPFLDPGAYTITGPGGADVGTFTAQITIGPPLNWTNRATVGNSGPDTISRAGDVKVTWTGGTANDFVTITGVASNTALRATASFTCVERALVGQFTVPSYVLSALPPATTGVPSLGLSPLYSQNRFQASGLDRGYVYYSTASTRTIAYQ